MHTSQARQAKAFFNDDQSMLQDAEFADLLQQWLRCCKVDNMGVERQLASIRKASMVPNGKPFAERVVSCGLLTQWRKEHTRSGFTFSGAASREDALQHGAPLRCRKQELTRIRGTPGNMTFMAGKRKQRKERSGRLPRADFKVETARLNEEWFGLSDVERQSYVNKELTSACDRRDLLASRDALDEVAADRLKTCRFGLSDLRFPFGRDAFVEVIEREVGNSEAGFTNYSEKLRQAFLEDVVVRDSGAIPVDRAVRREVPCSEEHPGVCATGDEAIYSDLTSCAYALEQCLLKTKEARQELTIGTMYRATCTYADNSVEHVHGCLAYFRGSGPRLAVFAAVALQADGFLRLEVPLKFHTAPALLKSFFVNAEQASGVAAITLEALAVRSLRGSLVAVSLVSALEPATIFPCSAKPSRSKAAKAPEIAMMDQMFAGMIPRRSQPAAQARDRQPGVLRVRKLAHVVESESQSGDCRTESSESDFSADDVADTEDRLAKKLKVGEPPPPPIKVPVVAPRLDDLAPEAEVVPPDVPHQALDVADFEEEPAARVRRVGDGGWPRLLTGMIGVKGESVLRLSVNQHGHSDLRAFCGHCGNTLSRTCKPDRRGQGRPIGLLGAWLFCGSAVGCHHKGVWPIPHLARVAGRVQLSLLGDDGQQFFDAERDFDPVLDDPVTHEPLSIP